MNSRQEALDTLLDMEGTGKLSHIAVGETLMKFQFAPKQDRAFYTLLCEGTTEYRIYLDYMLDAVSRTKMKKCKPFIRNLLRLSAYQILFTEVRDAAACNEAVNLAKKRGFKNLAGFVNGVLRNLTRRKNEIKLPDRKTDLVSFLSVRYSMPAWIVDRFVGRYGADDTERMLASFLSSRPTRIRTNRSRISPDQLAEDLRAEGIHVEEAGYFPGAFTISGYDSLKRIRAFRAGCFTVQDLSSMLPAGLAALQPGDRVLDLCAAPGGKSFHAADIIGAQGRLIARDLTENKIELIKENNDRIGFSQIETQVWDAREFDQDLEGWADLVIADLPCSGLGIMGRKNDLKYHIRPEQIQSLVQLQREILAVAWRYVRPSGQLIFSTCTINQEENEENVRWILDHTPLTLSSIEERLPEELRGRGGDRGYIQVLPGIDKGDGFFVSCFTRPSAARDQRALDGTSERI